MKTDMYQLLRVLSDYSRETGIPVLLLLLASEDDLCTKIRFLEHLSGQ